MMLRWLRMGIFQRRQGCIFIGVAVLLWAATVININTSSLLVSRESEQLKTEVIRLSKQYIQALARDSEGVVDGPYAGRFTAYDLKKTMAVLLENIMERLDRVEHRLNITAAPSRERRGDHSRVQIVHAKDLIRGEEDQCSLTEKEKQLYPKCLGKIAWMHDMWKSDPCYEAYGVDGSQCSFIMYLSEVEGWCPRSAWHGSARAPAVIANYIKANTTTDMTGLMDLLKDPNERQGYAWMRMRIKRIWPRWQMAISSLVKKQDMSQRKQQKVLVHLGLLSKQSGWKFAENQFKGGPLGELVQWSDLITALYVLGHQLTITSETEQLRSILSQLPAANSPCQSRKDLPVHIIYTDIVGLKQFKKYVKNGYGKFSCLLRIVDSFGTEPAFNLRSFAKQRKKLTSWGGQDLQPQQFFTMFPHSPDNSFMGFVVEQYLSETNVEEIPRMNLAVVYGKNTYMWQGQEEYLTVLNKTGIAVHGTVYVEQTENSENIPDFVINHGILNGEELHLLLRQAKIFVGLGFPYEGPAPLEAIANGAVFLNPKFSKPKNRNSDPFFKGKPTEREVTSQHPYAEQFIGEPYVYTINIADIEEVRTTIQKILDADHFKGYMPYEYTEEGFIQRMNAYIEHQNFCQFQKKLSKWPPESAVQFLLGEAGKSCKDVCWEKNLICEPSHFLETNAHAALISHGAHCASNKTLVDIFYPALDMKTNDCILQQEELLFSCVGKQENLRRLCPCRNYVKGQTALCVGCEV